MTLNGDKCVIAAEELDFFGYHFSVDGISIKEKRHAALLEAEVPTTASELRSFLGLAQYCERSTPCLAETTQYNPRQPD